MTKRKTHTAYPDLNTLISKFIGIFSLLFLITGITNNTLAQKLKPFTPAEFSNFIHETSEAGGRFSQDNWISNELSYLEVLEDIKDNNISGGVYIGVGPDQNYTYIHAIKPDIAFIVDIRHLNRMQHLIYKILFEISDTRLEYLSNLFSIPVPSNPSVNENSNISDVFDYIMSMRPEESLMDETEKKVIEILKNKYKYKLENRDLREINYVLDNFYWYGPDITYRGDKRSWYPTYAEFISLKLDDKYLNPFNTRDGFLYLKKMHIENRIIPLTGDFGGTKAIQSVSKFLKEKKLSVTAYYLSNVEQYVIRDYYKWENWIDNIKSLPITNKSVFIRWTHENSGWNQKTRIQYMKTFLKNADNGDYNNYSDIIYDDYILPKKKK